jgi:hypothetical protein
MRFAVLPLENLLDRASREDEKEIQFFEDHYGDQWFLRYMEHRLIQPEPIPTMPSATSIAGVMEAGVAGMSATRPSRAVGRGSDRASLPQLDNRT